MIRFGVISEILVTGLVRVNFKEDDLVTGPIPICFPGTSGDQYFFLPDEGTNVACLMDENCENGVVLGAIYNSKNKPSAGAKDKTYVQFKDGTTIIYDRSAHKYTITIGSVSYEISDKQVLNVGNTTLEINSTGFKIQTASESLKAIISDTLDAIEQITVTCAAPGAPSTPPINLAAFAAIKARLSNLLQ